MKAHKKMASRLKVRQDQFVSGSGRKVPGSMKKKNKGTGSTRRRKH